MATCASLIFLCLFGLTYSSNIANSRFNENEQYDELTKSPDNQRLEMAMLRHTVDKIERENEQLLQKAKEFSNLFSKVLKNINELEKKSEINSKEIQSCKHSNTELLQSHVKLQLEDNFDVLNRELLEQKHVSVSKETARNEGSDNIVDERNQIANSNPFKTTVTSKETPQSSSRVALTACVYTDGIGPQPEGHVIKFSDVRSSIGIDNLSSFKSNGKFACEVEGLYLVSLTFISTVRFGEVGLYKNGTLLTRTFTTTDDGGQAYSSTIMAAVELQPNENVWVQVNYRTTMVYTYNWQELCLTIAKIT